jgi:vitamin B12 transporter
MHPNHPRAAAPRRSPQPSLHCSRLALHAADQQLDSIVVTATRQATRTNELTSDVSVITREEIDQAGETTLAQLLARQPGIQYVANGGAGSNSGVFIRGASTNQSIVLIDGQRIGSATTGSAALSRIPLNQIERIEILRGPASSLYGADAIGGVIQIFTRRRRGAGTGERQHRLWLLTTRPIPASALPAARMSVSYSVQAGYTTPTASTPSTTRKTCSTTATAMAITTGT